MSLEHQVSAVKLMKEIFKVSGGRNLRFDPVPCRAREGDWGQVNCHISPPPQSVFQRVHCLPLPAAVTGHPPPPRAHCLHPVTVFIFYPS